MIIHLGLPHLPKETKSNFLRRKALRLVTHTLFESFSFLGAGKEFDGHSLKEDEEERNPTKRLVGDSRFNDVSTK